ncbi:MAG: dihydrodipicolinate synthase family protein, partial [Pseudomonadota bacterium]
VIAPYYNKPTQEGLYQHFKTAAAAADIPIVLYNVPGRTVSDIEPATVARVARDVPNVVGIKDASADLVRMWRHRTTIERDFSYVSGEDATILGFRAYGGNGCISVTSNVAPRLCALFHAACDAGDYTEAGRLNDLLMPLHGALFIETSPAPVKYALARLGMCDAEMRLPMVPVSADAAAQVDAALAHAELL